MCLLCRLLSEHGMASCSLQVCMQRLYGLEAAPCQLHAASFRILEQSPCNCIGTLTIHRWVANHASPVRDKEYVLHVIHLLQEKRHTRCINDAVLDVSLVLTKTPAFKSHVSRATREGLGQRRPCVACRILVHYCPTCHLKM
jgi:hypothetical protein